MKFDIETFKRFCSSLRVDTKDDGEIRFAYEEWKGTQRYVIDEIAKGLEDGVHTFVILKGRQQGISTVLMALDLYWMFSNGGTLGSLVTHNEETRDEFRTTLEMMIDSLPQKFKVPVAIHNRTQFVAKNRSRFSYQVAGTRKNTKLGKGKGLMYIHGTEVSEWGDEEGFASLRASMSETHPNRLEIYESTAQGYNFFERLWSRCEDSVSVRGIFVGWWRNETYRRDPGTNEYRVYWESSPRLTEEERKWVREIEEEYGYEIVPEQIAWWRWTMEEVIGDQDKMYQNHPPTATYAFIATGKNFFSTARLTDEMREIRKRQQPDIFRFVLRDTFGDCDIVESPKKHANLWVWEHASVNPNPDAFYVLGADPAYGSSDWADRFCVSVWRAYSDGLDQVAEFCTDSCNTYQFAWVMLYLAGHYRNVMINLEINGPGMAVWNEILSMKRQAAQTPTNEMSRKILHVVSNLQNYLYRRLDGFSRPAAYHWKSDTNTKERMLNFYKDCFERGWSTVRSPDLIEEMQEVVREEGSLGAPGRGKDDRVIAAGLAHEAWGQYVRNQCMARNVMKPKALREGDLAQVVPINPGMRGYLKRIGIRA